MHAFNTPEYATEVIAPLIEEGATRADRSRADIELSASPFVVTGEDEQEREASREEARRRLAFYGSTRTYHDVLAHHGWAEVGRELHELSTEQRWEEMTELVSDEMLVAFAIEVPPAELLAEAKGRLRRRRRPYRVAPRTRRGVGELLMCRRRAVHRTPLGLSSFDRSLPSRWANRSPAGTHPACSASGLGSSRNSNFLTFPLGVFGSSSTR